LFIHPPMVLVDSVVTGRAPARPTLCMVFIMITIINNKVE